MSLDETRKLCVFAQNTKQTHLGYSTKSEAQSSSGDKVLAFKIRDEIRYIPLDSSGIIKTCVPKTTTFYINCQMRKYSNTNYNIRITNFRLTTGSIAKELKLVLRNSDSSFSIQSRIYAGNTSGASASSNTSSITDSFICEVFSVSNNGETLLYTTNVTFNQSAQQDIFETTQEVVYELANVYVKKITPVSTYTVTINLRGYQSTDNQYEIRMPNLTLSNPYNKDLYFYLTTVLPSRSVSPYISSYVPEGATTSVGENLISIDSGYLSSLQYYIYITDSYGNVLFTSTDRINNTMSDYEDSQTLTFDIPSNL